MQKTRSAAMAVVSRLAGKGTLVVLALFFVFLAGVSSIYIYAGGRVAHAAAASTMNFQARVLQANGAVVADGSYSVEFKLYDAAAAGTNEWTETQNLVAKNGYITASLGSVTPFPGTIDWSQEHWLTLNVNGDGEMGPTRMKLTAVPYSFRSGQADTLTNGSGTITAAGLLQLSAPSMQNTNSATPALQVNQQGVGELLKLQTSGVDKFTISNNGDVTAAGGLTVGNSTSTTAGTIRWNGSAFEGYNGSAWTSLGGGLVLSSGAVANFTSGLANVAGTVTGAAVETMVFTSATGVSNTAGITGFTAPAAGSFRTCLVKNNAAITAGTFSLRWRVNGVSVGAAACPMNATTNRQSATSLDAGVVTFNAGDTIGLAVDTVGMLPAASNDFTAYWSVEYSSSSSSLTMQKVYDSSAAPVSIITTDNKDIQYQLSNTATDSNFLVNIATGSTGRFAVQNNGVDVLSVNSSGVTTGALSATAVTGTSFILGTDTVTDFTGTGLQLVGGSLEVAYGSTAGTAVAGDTSLVCPSGGGNLSGGGNTITLGTGGTCNSLSIIGNPTFSGLVTASGFSGDGSALTALNATNIASGALADARLSTNVTLVGNTFNAANKLVQLDGSGNLPALNASALTSLSATNVASGTLGDARLSANVSLLNAAQAYTALKTFQANIVLGTDTASPQAGLLSLHDATGSNGFTSVLGTNTLTASRNIYLPDEAGTLCIRNSTACGFIMLASGSAQTDTTTNASIFINKTGASGDLLTLQKNGTTVLSVLNSGALQLQLTSTAAFTVNSAGGTQFFNVDTSGALVRIGGATADANATLFILDTKNTTGDPTGADGGSYYNSADAKSRCYEDGYWTDCTTTAIVGETTLAAANGTINVTLAKAYESLECRIESKGRSLAGTINLRFNNVATAATYGWNTYYINGTAVADAQSASDTEIQLSSTVTATTPFSADVKITNFSDTNKAVDWTGVGVMAIGTNMHRFSGGGMMNLSSGSITSVQFLSSAGTFNAGSHAWCEGRNVR